MSLYLIIPIICALLTYAAANGKYEKAAYVIMWLVMTSFLALRFGQGTDWLAYNYIFNEAPSTVDFDSFFYTDMVHSEIGWKAINNVVKSLGFDFVCLSVATSLFEMVLLARFLNRYAPNRVMGLLLAYPVLFLTYYFSAFRQGIVIAVFLGIMIELLEKKRTLAYLLLAVALSFIHILALVLVLPLFAVNMKTESLKNCLCASVVMGLILIPFMGIIVSRLGLSYAGGSPSVLAIAYRSLMAALIYFLYSAGNSQSEYSKQYRMEMLIKLYLTGLSMYFLCMGNDLLASRLSVCLLVVEIALVPLLIERSDARLAAPLILAVVLLVGIMTVKNIDSYIEQGSYYSFVSVVNYPYMTIFEQNEIYYYTNNRYLAYL